jgi:hypothetical protein
VGLPAARTVDARVTGYRGRPCEPGDERRPSSNFLTYPRDTQIPTFPRPRGRAFSGGWPQG